MCVCIYTHRRIHALLQLLFKARASLRVAPSRSPTTCSICRELASSIPKHTGNQLIPQSQTSNQAHTQHRRHNRHTRILFMLIRTTNSEMGNRLQTDGVETGRNTLGRHVDGVFEFGNNGPLILRHKKTRCEIGKSNGADHTGLKTDAGQIDVGKVSECQDL